ncbi:MAG TPA: hypothetical protein VGF68_08610 [Solirubrobacteraceae bacterium]|jgi:hypothetical protein
MSEISVITGAIEEMAGRMDGIAPGTGALHGQVQTHTTAAADTPAHDALSGLMGHWATFLPHFGLAGDRLSAAMRGAAHVYQQSDAAVGRAADDHG